MQAEHQPPRIHLAGTSQSPVALAVFKAIRLMREDIQIRMPKVVLQLKHCSYRP